MNKLLFTILSITFLSFGNVDMLFATTQAPVSSTTKTAYKLFYGMVVDQSRSSVTRAQAVNFCAAKVAYYKDRASQGKLTKADVSKVKCVWGTEQIYFGKTSVASQNVATSSQNNISISPTPVVVALSSSSSRPSITSLTANPATVEVGGSSTISVTSTGMTGCKVVAPNEATTTALSINGSFQTGPLTVTKTYTIQCDYVNGSTVSGQTKTVTIFVVPVGGVSTSTLNVVSGGSSAINLGALTITSAELFQGWYYGDANQKKTGTPSDWVLVDPGTKSAMWKSPAMIPAPTLTASWEPSVIKENGLATRKWSTTNATRCKVTYPDTGSVWGDAPVNYAMVSTSLTKNDTSVITCYNQIGQSVSKTITLTVIPVSGGVSDSAVTDIYMRILGRNPDTASLTYWSNQLTQGYKTKAQIESEIKNSDEAFIVNLYVTELGRRPEPEGVTYYMNQLSQKLKTRLQIVDDIHNSPEAVQYRSTARSTLGDNQITVVLGVSTSSTCTNLPINLHRGMEKPSVSRLQSFLLKKGFLEGEITGFYGDKTVEAVKDYQASIGLPVTGMVYDFTREAIRAESCQ